MRRRRANVLFVLLMATCATLFLAATTHANAMMYAFALSFLALCGYCYKLVQLREIEQYRRRGTPTTPGSAPPDDRFAISEFADRHR